MLTLRPLLLAALALALACSTEHPGGDPLYRKVNTSDPDLVWLASAMPIHEGAVRIKVNGKFIVWDLGWDYGDPDPPYIYIEGGMHQLEVIPSGAQLDLVDSAGQTLLHFEAPEPFTPPARVWVHDSPAGLVGEVLDMTPDDDPTTAEVTVAQPLDEARQAALTEQLRRAVGARVAVDIRVDPALLGGMIVKVGSRMVDASLSSRLQRLRLAMRAGAQ